MASDSSSTHWTSSTTIAAAERTSSARWAASKPSIRNRCSMPSWRIASASSRLLPCPASPITRTAPVPCRSVTIVATRAIASSSASRPKNGPPTRTAYSRPCSDLPIEPSRTEQQPRQAATQPAWVRRWIDRGWVKLNDDWAKECFEAFGQAAGEVQLFARALARQPAIPGGAEERRRRCRVEDPGRHSATDVQLLGAGDGERNDRRPGTEGNQRPTDAERSDAPGRTAHRSFGHLGE